MQMHEDVLAHGLQAMLWSVTEAEQASLLWPGRELPSRLERAPAPSVYKRETHGISQIAYVESGNCVIVLCDRAYPVQVGDICFVPPGKEHYEAPAACGSDYALIWFTLYPSRVYAHETVYSSDQHMLMKTCKSVAWINADTGINYLLDALYCEIETRKPLASVMTKSCFIALLALLTRQSIKQGYSGSDFDLEKHPNPVARAMALYVKQHYTDPHLSVGHIAAKMAFNPKYFIEYIHKQTGYTPYNYILHFRLEKAKQHLTETDWSIARISEEVGFTSPYNFSVAFKRSTGLSPKQFRLAMQVTRSL
jgi:AraC-like DNA-binding protein